MKRVEKINAVLSLLNGDKVYYSYKLINFKIFKDDIFNKFKKTHFKKASSLLTNYFHDGFKRACFYTVKNELMTIEEIKVFFKDTEIFN